MNAQSKSLINLLRGWPNPSLLPIASIQSAVSTALRDPAISVPGLLYGPDWGYEPLRAQVASWLTKFYKPADAIDGQRLCITGGASQNLACILQSYSDPVYTRNVWMVQPTYFLACRIFEDSGFKGRLRAVPEDDGGIDIDFLRKGLIKSEKEAEESKNSEPRLKPPKPWNKMYKHLIYAVPTFSNPSSKTMTLQRRQQLVRIAREFDALIITDDVYDLLQWEVSPSSTQNSPPSTAVQPRLVDVDRYLDGGAERPGADCYGNAVSNGSFSKIIGPGCRTGWSEGTIKFAYGLSQVGSSRSGGAPSQLTATFISSLLASGDFEDHIRRTLQPAYARRYRLTVQAIATHLSPLGVILLDADPKIAGGYFVWFKLPEGISADDVAARANEDENLIIAQGSLFGVAGDTRSDELRAEVRICFAWEEEAAIVEGIERLGRVVKRMLHDVQTGHLHQNGSAASITTAPARDSMTYH